MRSSVQHAARRFLDEPRTDEADPRSSSFRMRAHLPQPSWGLIGIRAERERASSVYENAVLLTLELERRV